MALSFATPSLSSLSSPPFPPPLPSLSLSLEVGPQIQLGGLGERCKLLQRGLGGAPAEIEFGAF